MASTAAELTALATRGQLASEVAHWRAAAHGLTELDSVAAPAAWAALERYLDRQVRSRLMGIGLSLAGEADQLATAATGAATAQDLDRIRERLISFRRRYLQAETVIDFYAEAVNTRTTPKLGRLLRGLDSLAVDSMDAVLRPLGIESPPVLTYLDKGLGASILRAGVRLWDSGALSPAAAIKITRHNLLRPTSLIHETFHQVAHLTGFNDELANDLHTALLPFSPVAAAAWKQWAREVAADVGAFALLGYAPVPALANVVDGTTPQVFAMPPRDPHPFAWLRVMFNAALCSAWFGDGPWDTLREVWSSRHSLDHAPPGARHVAVESLPHLRLIVGVCTRKPMRAFGGRSLAQLCDPRRVSPTRLIELAARAGDSLYTSSFLQRHESLRILSYNTMLAATSPERAPDLAKQLEGWLERLGAEPLAVAA
ncbi:MAG: hypothetical protein ACXVUE_08885 [Solirubrobacteraceae bacterium]